MKDFLQYLVDLDDRWFATAICIYLLLCFLGNGAPTPKSWKMASVRIWRYFAKTIRRLRITWAVIQMVWIDDWRKRRNTSRASAREDRPTTSSNEETCTTTEEGKA